MHLLNKIDLRRYFGEIKCPVLIMAGEQDQLSPIEVSHEVFDLIKSPKEICVYKGANHSVADAPSLANGEHPRSYLAGWQNAFLVLRLKASRAL